MPPVSPRILTFLNFLPIKKIIRQGNKVLKKGLILTKIYLAAQKLRIKGMRKTIISGLVWCLSLNL